MSPAEETVIAEGVPATEPELRAMMPGALMYWIESSIGLPPTDIQTTRQLQGLRESSTLRGIDAVELDLLIWSIARTTMRAEYHYQRFCAVMEALGETRDWAPAEVFWDARGDYLHFELQALAGAARLAVDELIFLVGARVGQSSRAIADNWRAHQLFREPVEQGSVMDVPEIHRLRRHREWFDRLNAYRNVFFHAGWIHGSGHYADGLLAADEPAMNALLVPDQASLTNSSKPYDWTYNDRTTADDVAAGIRDGLIAMLNDICSHCWDTAVPPHGTASLERRSNLIIQLPTPLLFPLRAAKALLVFLFSTKEKAERFYNELPKATREAAGPHELLEIRSAKLAEGTESLSVSLRGLEPDKDVDEIGILLDPEREDANWSKFKAANLAAGPASEILADKIRIVSLPVPERMSAFLWRSPLLHE